jgi:hypothetical protein
MEFQMFQLLQLQLLNANLYQLEALMIQSQEYALVYLPLEPPLLKPHLAPPALAPPSCKHAPPFQFHQSLVVDTPASAEAPVSETSPSQWHVKICVRSLGS